MSISMQVVPHPPFLVKTKAFSGMAGKTQKTHWVPEDEQERVLLA